MMNRILDFVIRRPVIVIVAIIAITIYMALGIFKLQFENSLEVMMPKKDAEYVLNEKTKAMYGNNGNFIIMTVSSENAMTPSFLHSFDLFHTDIEEYETYDEEKESSRLRRFVEAAGRGNLSLPTLRETFRDDQPFVRTLERKWKKLFADSDSLSARQTEKLKKDILASQAMKKKQLIDAILSPYTAQDLTGKDDTLITYKLIDRDENNRRIIPSTKKEIEIFGNRLRNNPAFDRGIFVLDRATGSITDFSILIRLINGELDYTLSDDLQEIAAGYPELHININGIPYVNTQINHYMQRDLKTFLPLTLISILIIFFLNFRSLRGVFLPFLSMNFADIWIMGLMGHLGFKVSVMGVCIPPLMLAVGSSYSIHLLNQYYIDFNLITAGDKRQGIRSSMSHISLTVILAGFTTFIGFLMLMTNGVYALKEWGIFSAIGVLFAVFISITFIPAMLVLLPIKAPAKRRQIETGDTEIRFHGFIDKIIYFFTWLSIHHYKKVLAGMFIVVIFAIAGTFRIIAETSILAYFKEGNPILTSTYEIGKKFGGSFGINILIDSGKDNGVLEPDYLILIDKTRQWLESEENKDINIGRTDAFPDFVKTMNLAMNNNDKKFYSIPEKRSIIEGYMLMFSGDDDNDDGRIDIFEPYVDHKFRTANIFARQWERNGAMLSTAHLVHSISRIEEYLDSNLPPGYSYKITGEPKIMVRLMYYIVMGQMMSLVFSLAVVCFIVILLFKNIAAGLTALIPISLAVIFNFGIMGWFGIRLDTATAIIASITIGIGIDDTIHFLNNFRHYRRQGLTVDETITKTLAIAGRAIIYTSLALIFGFLVLTVSNFKPIVLFSFLTAVTMVATTIGALLVLPSAIKATGITLEESQSDSPIWKYLDLSRFFSYEEND